MNIHSSMALISKSVIALAVSVALIDAAGAAQTQKSWAETVAAAEEEGTITIIAPPIPTHRATLARFQEAYPKISVQISGLTSSEFEPRVDAERKAGLYLWDVMVPGASLQTYTLYVQNNWLASIRDVILPENAKDELWLGGFESGFLDAAKKTTFAFGGMMAGNMYVNRNMVSEAELNSITDLLKPEFKGRIATFDPRVGGPGASNAAYLYIVLGKERMSTFWRDQAVATTTTPRQLTEWVIRGQYPVGIGMSDTDVASFRSRGVADHVVAIPVDIPPPTPQWGVVHVFDNAPHPNAAKVFVNWLLSKDTQSDWATRSRSNSRRLDAERGDSTNVLSAEAWKTGLNLSAEAYMGARKESDALVKAMLK